MTALNISLSYAELSFIENFDTTEELSEGATRQFNELKAAMNESGQKFTRLAYKSGESAIRRFLASHDFTLWEDYLTALQNLGSAGKAVRSLAISIARFVCGGRVARGEQGGWYFRPTATFLTSATMDGVTLWAFGPMADNERINEALDFARENKGKLFTLTLTREPKKVGPLDSLLDAAFKNVYALSRKGSEDKKEAAKARKVENAILDLAADSGIDADKIRAAMQILAGANANVLKAKIAKAKAAKAAAESK